jgi:flagellin-like protein
MKKKRFKREVNSFRHKEKAISPVISTILLIMLVIIIAIIILLWFRVFLKEVIEKDVNGVKKPIDAVCGEVQLKEIINPDNTFGVTNEGNVAIHSIKLKVSKTDGTSDTIPIDNSRLNPGFSMMFEGLSLDDYESVKAIPILLGKRKSATAPEPYECSEKNGIDIK